MNCLECGNSNAPESLHCVSCGAVLGECCTTCGSPLSASHNFCGKCGSPRPLPGEKVPAPLHLPVHLAKRIVSSRNALEGERKQITVLFADIKGSTSLIEGLDPEQVEQRLRPALRAMINAVHRYEGTVSQILGDGIMALFGAPLALEDNAVRAAYAALEMQNTVSAACEADISIRVGLHAGEVLVRAIHNDLSVDYGAIGETVHLAARMEQMAPPGTIYCTTSVMRLIRGLVEARPLGRIPVKGFREPLDLFQVVAHTAARTRWEVMTASGLTQFVGRVGELAALKQVLGLAGASHGQVVGLIGEPGSGKSRLVHEFLQFPQISDWTVLKTIAIAYTKSTPYLPIYNLLRSWCEISEKATSEEIKQCLSHKIGALGEALLPTLPALQSLLGVPVDDSQWLMLEPAARRRRIMSAVKDVILRSATIRPLLIWFEDIQWSDTETQTLLDGLIDAIGASRLLIIITYRPEYEHKWTSKSYYNALRVDPLDADAADSLVEKLLGNDPDNEQLRALIVQRTGGTPLFIEETINTLAESGALRGHPGAYVLTQELRSIRIPETVQAVLATRIDRLGSEQKALLQTASVFGPEVPITLLREIADLTEHKLQDVLGDLQAAEFLYESPTAASVQFKFRHALTHEVAYNGLLSSKRQILHGRVLRAMELQYQDSVPEHLESLAHHAVNARLWNEAVTYCRRAGNKAVEFSAYREANAFFELALLALTHLPRDNERIQVGIDVRLGLRAIFGATAEYRRLEECLLEAEALATSINDRSRLATIYVAKTLAYNLQGDLDESIKFGTWARNIAREIGDDRLQLAASLYLAQAYMWHGEFPRVLHLLQNGAWTDGPLRHERIVTTGTSSVMWFGMLAASHAYLGEFQAAIAAGRQACAIADEVRRPYDVALAYWYAGFVSSHKGDVPAGLALLEHGFEACRSAQINFLIPVISTSLGHTYVQAGRISEGVELLTKAVGMSRGAKFHYAEAWSTLNLGFAKLLNGLSKGVFDDAQRIRDLARSRRYRAVEVASCRLMGDACRNCDGPGREAAEFHFLEACELARDLGLWPEYAQCQYGLARTYLQAGRQQESHNHMRAASDLYRRLDMVAPEGVVA
jgi:class 3 adenylate cyclase/tetratricopeptide (TPR) repeat protein